MKGLLSVIALVTFSMIAHAETIVLVKENCDQIIQHVPSADVVYKEGVDVRGKKVVSADLNKSPNFEPPKEFTIDLNYDVTRNLKVKRDTISNDITDLNARVAQKNLDRASAFQSGDDALVDQIDQDIAALQLQRDAKQAEASDLLKTQQHIRSMDPEAKIAQFQVKDGEIYYKGQLLGDQSQKELIEKCRLLKKSKAE